MLKSRKLALLFTLPLLASTSAYAQIGASQTHNSNKPKVVVQSGSTFKTDSTVTVEGGSEFKQDGGSKVVVSPSSGLKIDQTGGDKRPQPAATAVKNTQGFTKSTSDSSNTTAKQNKNPEMSPGGLEASKAKCEAACKEKFKSLDKFKPDSGASDQVLASAGTPEQKDAIKAKKEAEAKNEADYQACLAKCPK